MDDELYNQIVDSIDGLHSQFGLLLEHVYGLEDVVVNIQSLLVTMLLEDE